MFEHRINQALQERAKQGLTRQVHTLVDGNRTVISHDNAAVINFSSNDYLGLANDPHLIKEWQSALDVYGSGSGASPLVTGHSLAHKLLEQSLCEWLGFERAILFNSGFSANQALLFSLLQKGDLLLQDKLNHASLIEAGILSPATMKRFKHNDMNHLSQLLSDGSFVVTEGVFSMDGDLAPLADIHAIIAGKAWLAVDDAHGVGVLGREGRGSCDHAGIKPNVLVTTFGKAFGLSGAAIMCDHSLGDYLTQFARHYVYSTAMPPAQASALTSAVTLIRQQEWRRDQLLELNQHYAHVFAPFKGYVETQTPIKPLIIGDSKKATYIAERLREEGFWVTAIRPPTVPQGSARLRITLTTNHTTDHLDQLATSLQCVLKEVD